MLAFVLMACFVGTADSHGDYSYDPAGNVLTDVQDRDNDGIADFLRAYAYDGYGNLVRDETDGDGDGALNIRYAYTFAC